MKQIIIIAILGLFISCQSADKDGQKEEKTQVKDMFLDENAEQILDGMSKNIGSLNSCSFTIHSAVKAESDSTFRPTREYDIYFKDSNKLYVHAISSETEYSLWYNGKSLKFFNFLDDSYDSISYSGKTMEMITKINEERGLKFPGADFFYPSLTDDLVQLCDSVVYIGDTTVSGVSLSVIKANNTDLDIYIFVNNEKNLPGGLFFHNKSKGNKYKSYFMNWRLDPNLPDIMFEFSPPSHANLIEIKNI